MLSHLHRAAELVFLLYINWAKNRTMIEIGRMQVPKRKALYPSINGNDNDDSDNLFIHTIQVQGEKRKKKRETTVKRNW